MQRRYIRSVEKSTMDEIEKTRGNLEIGVFQENDLQRLHHLLQDAFTQTTLDIGAGILGLFLDREVEQFCGQRYSHSKDHDCHRHGKQAGSIYMGGQKTPILKPRVRGRNNREVILPLYKRLQNPELFGDSVLRHMLHGVSCRKYDEVIEHTVERLGVKKSTVSAAFQALTKKKLAEFERRRLDQDRWIVLFVDGKPIGGEMVISVLGVNKQGEKGILGFRQGSTENAVVAVDLFQDLKDHGLDVSEGVLFVIDGSKALRSAIHQVFGDMVYVQRCRVHKKRNVLGYLPKNLREEIAAEIDEAYQETDIKKAREALNKVATRLERVGPDAAASMREGLDETLTALQFNVPEILMKSIMTTNPMESVNSMVEDQIRRVKRWGGFDMRKRWMAAGYIEAEKHANRIKGCKYLDDLENWMKKDLEKRFGKLDESKGVA